MEKSRHQEYVIFLFLMGCKAIDDTVCRPPQRLGNLHSTLVSELTSTSGPEKSGSCSFNSEGFQGYPSSTPPIGDEGEINKAVWFPAPAEFGENQESDFDRSNPISQSNKRYRAAEMSTETMRPSQVSQQISKHQSLASTNNCMDLQPATVASEARPKKSIRLMGTWMGLEVEPSQFNNMKHSQLVSQDHIYRNQNEIDELSERRNGIGSRSVFRMSLNPPRGATIVPELISTEEKVLQSSKKCNSERLNSEKKMFTLAIKSRTQPAELSTNLQLGEPQEEEMLVKENLVRANSRAREPSQPQFCPSRKHNVIQKYKKQ
ncbi:hypothetical protein PGT21_018520 [Puccinia graminis f. sp. tritici]|uniref:Uncharacterized protein n=1 Tax=Puccinia graminis f. sp. tritici TaxID=56615 RepID=A0A5B0Q3G0_PUCGR|nr:hypothetical protein PGT21_018520 [Puccinia graminis f. sp. tritici]